MDINLARRIVLQADRRSLLLETYSEAPQVKIGDELLCEISGLQIVMSFHGPMAWPRAKVKGRPQLIVCGALKRAVLDERRESVAAQWGVHTRTVANWRRKLGLTGSVGRAVHEFKAARMQIARVECPERFEMPGLAHLWTLTAAERRLLGTMTAGDRAWTPVELSSLDHGKVQELSLRLNRSVAAINSAKSRYSSRNR